MNRVSSSRPAVATSLSRGLFLPALASSVFFMVLAGIAYPLAVTGAARTLLPGQAQGSLVREHGVTIGSRLIGQSFTRPEYFHGRPSVTSGPDPENPAKATSQPYNAAASNASNQGALNRKLIDDVGERARTYRRENGMTPDAPVPVDAVTASASGLDPDISPANARLQAQRVAAARGRPVHEVLALLERHVRGRQLGVLGDPRINVLELNLALDAAWPAARTPR